MGSDVYSSVSGNVDKSLVEFGYMEQPCTVQPWKTAVKELVECAVM